MPLREQYRIPAPAPEPSAPPAGVPARIRELEEERDELLGLLRSSEFEAKCGRIMWSDVGEHCPADMPCAEHRRRARIEKATRGTP